MFETIDSDSERVYIIKEFDGHTNVKILEEQIEIFIKNDCRDLVLDMIHLDSIDSMFLSSIVRFRTKLSLGGRFLRIINYNEHIFKCFKLLNLDDHLFG